MKKKLKLNLGCGYDKRKGYLNLDIDPNCKPDKICDVTNPLPFYDCVASEIVLQDVLEHVIVEDAQKLLLECHRVLEVGGKLLLRVPSVDQIIKKYHDQPDVMMLFLYGDTSKSGVWGAHKYGYTPKLMGAIVDQIGYKMISSRIADTNYEFVLKKQKQVKPKIKIKGTGWYPPLKEIERLGGESIDVCTDVRSFLLGSNNSKKKVWCIDVIPPLLFGKVILRSLSRSVDAIYVRNESAKSFVKDVLKYSHLRTFQE